MSVKGRKTHVPPVSECVFQGHSCPARASEQGTQCALGAQFPPSFCLSTGPAAQLTNSVVRRDCLFEIIDTVPWLACCSGDLPTGV